MRSTRIRLQIRTYRGLWERVRCAAAASGRSVSAEVEFRLEREFWREENRARVRECDYEKLHVKTGMLT